MVEAMTTRTRLSVLLLSTPLLAFIVFGGMGKASSGGDTTFQHLRVFEDVVSLILNNYVEDAKVDKVMEGAMRGLADGLDPDSAYLTAADVKLIDPVEKVAAGDVGIELTRQYYLRVIAARDDSPAAKAGLQTGDYVRAIDGKPARDLSVFEGMRLLRGTPGTKVTLTVIRGNAAEPRQIELVREKTPGSVVTGKMLAPDLGYIRIAAFGTDATAKVRTQADTLSKSGARQLIIDVRHTAEGPFGTGLEDARHDFRARSRSQADQHVGATEAGREAAQAVPGLDQGDHHREAGRRGDHAAGHAPGHDRDVGRGGTVRVGPERQQARGADRRAHARPRRYPETRAAPRWPRPLAHDVTLSDARR
jgi:membrane-associated protease RseP (regulator of RpoE activity)